MNEELKQLLTQVYNDWGLETVNAIIRKIDDYPIRWRGTLRRSVVYKINDVGGDDAIEILAADYADFIDKGVNGTQINRNSPYSFRNTSFKGVAFYVKPWADSKGLNNWAVARNIVKKGFKPRPFFNSVIQQRAPQLNEAMAEAYQTYLDNQINDINRQ